MRYVGMRKFHLILLNENYTLSQSFYLKHLSTQRIYIVFLFSYEITPCAILYISVARRLLIIPILCTITLNQKKEAGYRLPYKYYTGGCTQTPQGNVLTQQ
jgi:hypothetical protein